MLLAGGYRKMSEMFVASVIGNVLFKSIIQSRCFSLHYECARAVLSRILGARMRVALPTCKTVHAVLMNTSLCGSGL